MSDRPLVTLTEDHTDRRRLAREATAAGWSVRELESRARAAAAPSETRSRRSPRSKRSLHPDQQAAIAEIADALTQALGCEVDVDVHVTGYRAQLAFESLEDALDLARRLRVRAVA